MPGVVCVLGCRVGSPAFARRAKRARDVFVERGAAMIVACGGRTWNGVVEADALAAELVLGGVPRSAIVRERCSLDTRDNACFAEVLLRRRGVSEVTLVTCSWHLARASRLFERAGLRLEGRIGVDPPADASRLKRVWWTARERVSGFKDERRSMDIAARSA